MKKAEILKTEIENGIAKIEKLESNQKEEVHKIYSECKLPQIRTVYLYKLHDKTNNLIAW